MSSEGTAGRGGRSLYQRISGGGRKKDKDWEGFIRFGNNSNVKNKDDLRIAFWNLNTMPETKHKDKFKDMVYHMKTNDYDIIGVCECNTNWQRVPQQNRPKMLFKDVWESVHTSFNHNTNDISIEKIQPGGTGIISTNIYANRRMEEGRDNTGLGRWTWVKYRGKKGLNLAVVSVYRPCNPRSDEGKSLKATFRQHKDFFGIIGRIETTQYA